MTHYAFLFGLVLSSTIAGYSADTLASSSCDLGTLDGVYLFHLEGSQNGQAYAESGTETYDGKGNIVGDETDSEHRTNEHYTGTYTLGADCKGITTYSDGSAYNIYVSPDGDRFVYTETDTQGNVISGSESRVSDKSSLPRGPFEY